MFYTLLQQTKQTLKTSPQPLNWQTKQKMSHEVGNNPRRNIEAKKKPGQRCGSVTLKQKHNSHVKITKTRYLLLHQAIQYCPHKDIRLNPNKPKILPCSKQRYIKIESMLCLFVHGPRFWSATDYTLHPIWTCSPSSVMLDNTITCNILT